MSVCVRVCVYVCTWSATSVVWVSKGAHWMCMLSAPASTHLYASSTCCCRRRSGSSCRCVREDRGLDGEEWQKVLKQVGKTGVRGQWAQDCLSRAMANWLRRTCRCSRSRQDTNSSATSSSSSQGKALEVSSALMLKRARGARGCAAAAGGAPPGVGAAAGSCGMSQQEEATDCVMSLAEPKSCDNALKKQEDADVARLKQQ